MTPVPSLQNSQANSIPCLYGKEVELITTHHMLDDQQSTCTANAMERFYTAYTSSRVMVYDDMLVYRVAEGWAAHATKEANDLIHALDLPLVAKANKGIFQNSFIVTPK